MRVPEENPRKTGTIRQLCLSSEDGWRHSSTDSRRRHRFGRRWRGVGITSIIWTMVALCISSAFFLPYLIGITPPSFATDGVIWHVILALVAGRSISKESLQDGVFHDIQTAIVAARPGDTIVIASGDTHVATNIQINKPLCLIGGGVLPDETTLICSRGSDSALEFLSTCKVANLTVKAELGCCLLHRSGRLTVDGCVLQCESNPLDFLSFPIVSTATGSALLTTMTKGLGNKGQGNSVTVSHTRIEGGAKAVSTIGDLALQRVRVIYARTSLFFWFDVDHD
ncbi:unnamed protein product [Rhodiola kirilowii]